MDQFPSPNPHQSCATPERSFPEQSGTYAVILHIEQVRRIKIGALGEHIVNPGFYAYVGSAFGPGGLRARLRHHLRIRKRAAAHWHIDYLRSTGNIVEVWWTTDAVKREHEWARMFHDKMSMKGPIAGFGSSDCNCVSHLFYSRKIPNMQRFSKLICSCCDNHAQVRSMMNTAE